MDLSDEGASFIAAEEGSVAFWYRDQGGWAIGIGHSGDPSVEFIDVATADDLSVGRRLSESEIWALFRLDARPVIECVDRLVTVFLSQTQFDRLVSFALNWGIGETTGFPATSILRLVNQRDFTGVARELVDGHGPKTMAWAAGRPYDKGLPGVRARRKREAAAFKEAPTMHIVTRDEWGATPASGMALAVYPMSAVWLHHSDTVPTDDPAYDMRLLQQIGMQRGFSDVSYTFGLHPDGTILEGRELRYVGAHTYANNSSSLAFVLIGNYDVTTPTDAQIASAQWLRDDLITRGYLTPGTYPTGGHRDAPQNQTGCPGNAAENALDRFRATSTQPPSSGEDMLTFRYIYDGLDWVFDGPSGLFFQCDDPDQITQVLDKIGVPALGQVSDATHRRYSALAKSAGYAG